MRFEHLGVFQTFNNSEKTAKIARTFRNFRFDSVFQYSKMAEVLRPVPDL